MFRLYNIHETYDVLCIYVQVYVRYLRRVGIGSTDMCGRSQINICFFRKVHCRRECRLVCATTINIHIIIQNIHYHNSYVIILLCLIIVIMWTYIHLLFTIRHGVGRRSKIFLFLPVLWHTLSYIILKLLYHMLLKL